ncbi:MAG TPA: lmo0937 family membrane protein [Novosphingobium sp.]
MWGTIAIILVILWLLGAFAFKVAGGIIHLLLILALIAVVVHFVRGRAV